MAENETPIGQYDVYKCLYFEPTEENPEGYVQEFVEVYDQYPAPSPTPFGYCMSLQYDPSNTQGYQYFCVPHPIG